MSFTLDAHVHTRHSHDARGTVLDLARAASLAGLKGFCLTDHDTVAGHKEIQDATDKTGVLIVPAIEVTTAEGHLLALGAKSDIERGLGYLETKSLVEDQGGIAVPAHPLRVLSGMGPSALQEHTDQGQVLAVEAINARERRIVQDNTRRLVERLGVSALGGSDAHWIRDIGTAYTVLEEVPATTDDVLDLIQRGRCHAEGGPLARTSVWGHSISLMAPGLRRRVLERHKK